MEVKLRKFIILAIGIAAILCLTCQNASALIVVSDYGETGWQLYSHTFDSDWTGRIGFAVSNYGDTGLNSVFLLDNLSHGPDGNSGFENGDLDGYDLEGDVTVESSFVSSQGNDYSPTEGSYMARLLANGADTSVYYGGTTGAYLWSPEYSFETGDIFSFSWAFLAFDYVPFHDFSFLLVEEDGEIVYTEQLAQIGIIPEPATMSLLGFGLLGLLGFRKKS
jgi:hypothetical protein